MKGTKQLENIDNYNIGLENHTKIKRIEIDKIIIDNEFSKIFDIDLKLLKEIKDDISNNGLDDRFPIFVWENEDELILVDGHTRFKALKELDKTHCYYVECNFKNKEDAKDHIYKYQLQRRNLSDNEKIFYVDYLKDKSNVRLIGDKRHNQDITQKLAEDLKISRRTASEIKQVAENPEANEKVKSGKSTIHKAYKELKNNEDKCNVALINQEHNEKEPKKTETSKQEVPKDNFVYQVSEVEIIKNEIDKLIINLTKDEKKELFMHYKDYLL